MEKTASLVLSLDGLTLFTSYGKWLHPLFELEAFLVEEDGIDRGKLLLRDRIVGKAAALLILRLGIRQVHAVTISSFGLQALNASDAVVSYDTIVERISCTTERLLLTIDDPEEAYRCVSQRMRDGKKQT